MLMGYRFDLGDKTIIDLYDSDDLSNSTDLNLCGQEGVLFYMEKQSFFCTSSHFCLQCLVPLTFKCISVTGAFILANADDQIDPNLLFDL